MTNAQIQGIKEYLLENVDELRQIVGDLNSWDGCIRNLDVMDNDEEFFNIYFDGKPMEAVRAAVYGDYHYTDDYVRFDGYGNLESLSEYDLESEMKDNIDEIIDLMIENRDNIDIPAEIEELLEEEEEE
jgi:hypothetical protein